MILVDTCVWIRHLRVADARLVSFLTAQRVVTCDVVIGELRLGSGLSRAFEDMLGRLASIPSVSAAETLAFIDQHRSAFTAADVGWADAMVIASAARAGALVFSTDDGVRRTWRHLGFREPA